MWLKTTAFEKSVSGISENLFTVVNFGDQGLISDDQGQVCDDKGLISDNQGQVSDDQGLVSDIQGQVCDDKGLVSDD